MFYINKCVFSHHSFVINNDQYLNNEIKKVEFAFPWDLETIERKESTLINTILISKNEHPITDNEQNHRRNNLNVQITTKICSHAHIDFQCNVFSFPW